MNLGDLMLSRKILKEVEETFSKIPEKDRKVLLMVSVGAAFLADMAVEMLESNTVAEQKFTPPETGYFAADMMASAASIFCLKVATRSNDIEVFLLNFKKIFEERIKRLKEYAHDHN